MFKTFSNYQCSATLILKITITFLEFDSGIIFIELPSHYCSIEFHSFTHTLASSVDFLMLVILRSKHCFIAPRVRPASSSLQEQPRELCIDGIKETPSSA